MDAAIMEGEGEIEGAEIVEVVEGEVEVDVVIELRKGTNSASSFARSRTVWMQADCIHGIAARAWQIAMFTSVMVG